MLLFVQINTLTSTNDIVNIDKHLHLYILVLYLVLSLFLNRERFHYILYNGITKVAVLFLQDNPTVVVEDLRLCTVKHCEDIERRFCFEVVSPTK